MDREGARTAALRLGLVACAVALATAACSGGSRDTVTILVDYSHDEFATQFMKYFPDRIQVHPGDTITFRQTWTGEPHTVTLGTLVHDVLEVTRPLVAEYGHLPPEEIPPEVFEAFVEAEGSLPLFWTDEAEETGEVPQVMAQPCLIERGSLPEDDGPCEVQDLPPFDGTEAYYNSGIIPFEGSRGNVFELELADTIEPGEYHFYCAVHGSFHSGTIEVVPHDQPVPEPAEVNVVTREEVNEAVAPFREVYTQAEQDGRFVWAGETHTGHFSGLVHEDVQGLLNEFIPRVIETGVGEPVTWRMFGPHSISFDVPEYFPIVEFAEDGTVRLNEELWPPAGGAPEVPEDGDPSEPLVVDGGTYDGDGFWSSGVLWSDAYVEYTLRFSEPGTYRYACLIHPPMVGDVRVRR
jgi:plastocyanin